MLLSLGRASLEKGLDVHLPGWGGETYATFPNGVKITLFNVNVLVLRPLGYRNSPRRNPALVASIDYTQIGVPQDENYILYAYIVQ